ncbi:hypothetical protein GIY23_11770 [Allosaccharopolyspora coralli]|uniref:Uncharacterized protein n=1 Tax=Allosaccharopolyspora coralli TaxID=2665642 RepID=A0A5Q3Q709_9PSEU|nr:hypothetical protein [Allosaccharopolyspora coralli]QGK70113.1 hypothetical protein GIY23_11770 [Allosaccharopolyspora coralli]
MIEIWAAMLVTAVVAFVIAAVATRRERLRMHHHDRRGERHSHLVS